MAINSQMQLRSKKNAAGPEDWKGNDFQEGIVAQGLPSGTEYTRIGARIHAGSVVAVAGLVVKPSTTAALEINNPSATKSLIITQLWNFNLVSTAAENQWSGWAQVSSGADDVTEDTAVLFYRADGKAYTGVTVADLSTTVVANGWRPYHSVSTKVNTTGVLPTGAQVAQIDGRMIVPPGESLCMHVVSTVVGQTFTQGAEWIEAVIDNAD